MYKRQEESQAMQREGRHRVSRWRRVVGTRLGPLYQPLVVCLLYTSDAADERSSVDLGGRRIIKKKTSEKTASGAHNTHRIKHTAHQSDTNTRVYKRK